MLDVNCTLSTSTKEASLGMPATRACRICPDTDAQDQVGGAFWLGGRELGFSGTVYHESSDLMVLRHIPLNDLDVSTVRPIYRGPV